METWQVSLDWEVLLGGNGGKRKLCIVPCHSHEFKGLGGANSEEEGGFKVIIWG